MTPQLATDTLRLRRLAWAGVEVTLGDTRILIDPLENVEPLAPVLGAPRHPVPPVDVTPGTHAILTHLHPDHYDKDLAARIAEHGTVGVYTPYVATLTEDGIDATPQDFEQPRQIGPFTVTPVFSMDWRGDEAPQVAWIVEGGGRRILHGGDTMWHGNWWKIGREHGPIDLAFLPVNGILARFDGQDIKVPMTLTPEHAVEATLALGAPALTPIHYGLFHNPPTYTEQPDIERRLRRAANERDIHLALTEQGAPVPFPHST